MGAGDNSAAIGLVFVGLIIALIPLVLGFLRRGLIPFLASLVLIAVYIVVFVVYDVRIRGYGIREEDAFIIVLRAYLFFTLFSAILVYINTKNSIAYKDERTFFDNKLFFQHGQLVQSAAIPINLEEVGEEPANETGLSEKLLEYLRSQMELRFSSEPNFGINLIKVRDLYLESDNREFLQIRFETIRSSVVSHFFNIQKIGDQMVVNTKIYIKSFYRWYDVLFFIVTAPIHYWLWIFAFVKRHYSADSWLGMIYQNNSFDDLDLEAYIKSSSFTLLSSVEQFAKDNGLMTNELQQVIVNQITNTQNITVKRSTGIRFGKISIASNQPKAV